ncbi:MAG: hypothetical protein Q8916_05965 [Bacteroidota bacterium]|nr:hypothetical protein [Bacteroidota bacterium]MDP4229934.1 hypothetical protein [Bacteroidota bacterium]MDP4237576.1 hypothetical protein [Bacteroidota bacterium]
MRIPIISIILLGSLLGGCDTPTTTPFHGGQDYDYLSWLQSMTKIRVSFTAQTLLQTYLKQGTLDHGNKTDQWLLREEDYEKSDSIISIVWQDSAFSARGSFAFRELDPSFAIEGDDGNNSVMSGTFHQSTKTISDLLCIFQKCEGCQDPNNYISDYAFIKTSNVGLESLSEDSISFVMTGGEGAGALGFAHDEVSYTTYIKQIKMTAFDTLGTVSPPVCRVVFYH